MKRLKYILIPFVVVCSVLLLLIIMVRQPSYTIQTSGKLYIVSKVSRDVQVFNLFTGKQIAKIPIGMLSHEAVATMDKKNIVLTNYELNEGHIVKVINTKTNTLKKTIALKDKIKANGIAAYTEPNKVTAVDYVRNILFVLNIETDSIERQIKTTQEKSHLVVMHPTKPMAYVTNVNSNSVSVIDLKKEEVVKVISCGLGRKGIDITPDGSEIWVTNTKENSITIINTSTFEVEDTLETGNEPLKLKFSINGKFCLVANAHDGTIYIFNQQSKKRVKTIMLHGKNTLLERILYHTPRPVNILMHPNGLYAFVSNSNANKIEVIDMKTFKTISTIGTGKVPDALAFVE